MGHRRCVARLRKPIERNVAHGHPWIWRDALDLASARPGDVVTVLDRRGGFLARGIADEGQIGVRVWTLQDRPLDVDFMAERAGQALTLRSRMPLPNTDAYRCIHGEGDLMPGVVVDRYAQHAVLKCDGAGMRSWSAEIEEFLTPLLRDAGVRSLIRRRARDQVARLEREQGRAPEPSAAAPLAGDPELSVAKSELAWGEMPAELTTIQEHGMQLLVDVMRGQKTGMFLDHRHARARVRAWAKDLEVLNLFSYTGGFSVAAGLGGARRVMSIDVAPKAIELCDQNWRINGLAPQDHEGRCADVTAMLGDLRASGRRFDLVISDPPSFAPNEQARRPALATYKRLHVDCIAMTRPYGLFLAASCSSHVNWSDFEETLREAAHQQKCALQVLERGGADVDHPTLPAFPEGNYLKSILLRVLPGKRVADRGL